MAHFAELDNNNIVLRVIVVSNNDCLDNGVESEAKGIAFCKALLGQERKWKQTSYNNNFRKQYAGIGYFFDEINDVFIAPQPYPSWSKNANFDWQAPTPMPELSENEACCWNEAKIKWDVVLKNE